jgi:hypothetical protein
VEVERKRERERERMIEEPHEKLSWEFDSGLGMREKSLAFQSWKSE